MKSKILINKNFSLMALAKLVSMSGSLIQEFALSLYVLKMTGSATKFASVLAVALIPQLIIGPFAGVIVDWFNKKAILILLDFLSGILTLGAIAFMITSDKLPMYAIYTLVIALSAVSVIYSIATGTLVVSIVDSENFVNANSVNSFIDTFTQITSSILGGVLYGFIGLLPCLIFNCISFFLSCFLIIFMTVENEVKEKEEINLKNFFKDFSEGLSFIKKQTAILKIVICAFFINFAIGPFFSVGLTFISKSIFKVSDMQYGLLNSFMVAGTLPITLIIPKLAKKFSIEKIFFHAIFSSSLIIGLIALSYSNSFINICNNTFIPFITFVSLIILTVNILIILNISLRTMVQQLVPKDMMGRVTSVMNTLSLAAMPFGQAILGKSFDLIDPSVVGLIVFAILFVVAVAYKATDSNHVQQKTAHTSE